MNPQNPHEVRVLNNVPLQDVTTIPLPPHRASLCPNLHAIHFSHSDLLAHIARCLDHHIFTVWFRELIDEAQYRGLIEYNSPLPVSREDFTRMGLRVGFALPEA